MPRKRSILASSSKLFRKQDRNLKQSIRRAFKNPNPLRGGVDAKTGKPFYVTGKKAQKMRVQLAKANNFFEKSTKLGLRAKSDSDYKMTARDMNFNSRKDMEKWFHYNNATAQRQRLNDKSNGFRQSFRTKTEGMGISKNVMDILDNRFKQLNNETLLITLNKNMENHNLEFKDFIDSDQKFTEHEQMKQLINMFTVLGLGDQVNKLSFDDINSGYVDNRNFTHYDFEQEARKENRNAQGRV